MKINGTWRLYFCFRDPGCKSFICCLMLLRGSKNFRIMGPNTLHYVVTPESAICHGGHAYATSTISQSIYGIFYTFVASSVVTKTEHTWASRLLLQRLVIYIHDHVVRTSNLKIWLTDPHIPQMDTTESSLDLFHLCALMEFGELLDPFLYGQEQDAGSTQYRINVIYARGCVRNLLTWWHSRFEHHSDGSSGPEKDYMVFSGLLEKQVTALLTYKNQAEWLDMLPDSLVCTAKAPIKRVLQSFTGPPHSIIDYSPSYRENFLESQPLHEQLSQSFTWVGTPPINIRSKIHSNCLILVILL
jgi:hypothetical protein